MAFPADCSPAWIISLVTQSASIFRCRSEWRQSLGLVTTRINVSISFHLLSRSIFCFQFWHLFLEKRPNFSIRRDFYSALRTAFQFHSNWDFQKFLDYLAETLKCYKKNWCNVFEIELSFRQCTKTSDFAQIFGVFRTKSTLWSIGWRYYYQRLLSLCFRFFQ